MKDSPVGIIYRGIAFIIDIMIIFSISFLVDYLFNFHFAITTLFIACLYQIFLPLFWNGYTIGKRILGIRISNLNDSKLTLGTIVIRALFVTILYYITFGILSIVSILLITIRKDKRSLHDLLGRTYVTSNVPD